MSKITLKEFYSVYGIELLSSFTNTDKKWLLILILPIAEKYLKHTKKACQHEAFHFGDNSECDEKHNAELVKRLNIENKKLKDITLKECYALFMEGDWPDSEYGGEAWGIITKTAIELETAIEKNNLSKIILSIDKLNQLEHNNDLYLSEYVTFNLIEHLEYKFYNDEKYILKECPLEIKKLWRDNKC
jgi:hypothetical protein